MGRTGRLLRLGTCCAMGVLCCSVEADAAQEFGRLHLPAWVVCYAFGPSAVALAVTILFGRHRVVPWLGGLLTAGAAVLALLGYVGMREGGECGLVMEVSMFAALPFLAAGIVLLIGALIRWGWSALVGARQRRAAAT
jgi:hypothetical protein